MPTLIPRQAVPTLSVPLLSGEQWSLSNDKPETFSLVVFYRGIFCPICRSYLRELDRLVPEFTALGVRVIALSSDTQEGAMTSQEAWKLKNLRLGYGLDLIVAQQWGLFISKGMPEELEYFSEPAVFLIRPDGTLYFSAVQTMPFARPSFADIVGVIKHVRNSNYPARGEVVYQQATTQPVTLPVTKPFAVPTTAKNTGVSPSEKPPVKQNSLQKLFRRLFR